jgi:alkylation response protein AidB-like acyl-CoA dehydrogenase
MATIIDRQDIDVLLRDWLRLEDVLAWPRFASHSAESIDAMLDLAQQIAERELAPDLRASDQDEPSMDANGEVTLHPPVARAVRLMAQAGLFSSVFDEGYGGLQLPHLVHTAVMGMLTSGAIAPAAFLLLTIGNARLITSFGSAEQITAFAEPQIAGDAMGTMCLSEPQAGSSLGDIRTRADPDGEDALGIRYRIKGAKMWISGGDHDATDNIVHLVLAKVPGADGKLPEGSRGISLFVVPKRLPDGARNDVTVAGLNHKMGYRGIPNTALNFGEGRFLPEGRAGAIGWRIGEPGAGLPQMFQMMNEARISVGAGAAMLASRGYQMSLHYARERLQGRGPGQNGGDQIPIIEHADVKRMLLTQKVIAEGAVALVFYSARLVDEAEYHPDPAARHAAGELLSLLTPITKTWPSEFAQEALSLALQIHGGSGYTRDFEIEQLYRDNRLNPIHEGTTGIQAIDLVGRKLRRDRGRAFAGLLARVQATLTAAEGRPGLAADRTVLAATWARVEQTVAKVIGEPDDQRALANATALLFALGHAVVGWLWLDQAVAFDAKLQGDTTERSASHLRGKLRASRYFCEAELPRVEGWLGLATSMTDTAAAMPADQF